MTLTVGFPSADFPGPPPFRFELPDGWKVVPSLHADAVVAAPDEIDSVRSNVVIANHKIRASENPEATLKEMIDTQLDRDDVVANSAAVEAVGNDGRAYSVRFTRLVPAGSTEPVGTNGEDPKADAWEDTAELIPVEQSLNLCYVPGPHIAYVLAATGTYAPGSDVGRTAVETIIRSVKY